MRTTAPLPLRLLTHNIRYATSSPFPNEAPWPDRLPLLLSELQYNTRHCASSFICLQEVLHNQLTDILHGLPGWEYIGVGRDDGKQAGEYSPILYQPSVWELKRWTTLWLSETPDRPSQGWDAACIRILTVGIFLHKESKKTMVAMSTHLDHAGPKARIESVKLILQEITGCEDRVDAGGEVPVFLAGDFNSAPDDEGYKTMTSETSPMRDVQSMVSTVKRYGHFDTFTGFKGEAPKARIDFLFINDRTAKNAWRVEGYAVLESRFDDGLYSSDHRAVVGDLTLQ